MHRNVDRPGDYGSRNANHYVPLTGRPSIVNEFQSAWLTVIIGLVMFSAGMWLLFWNEGRAVRMTQSLDETMGTIISLPSPIAVEENKGRLVHLNGVLDIGEPLTEPDYGVAIAAVKLKRRVQMYQWVEEETQRETTDDDLQGASISYSYTMEWRDKLVDSSQFYIQSGHYNPRKFPLNMNSNVYVSDRVTVGNFVVGPALKEKFTDFVTVTSDERPERRDIKLHSGLYYHSQDVWNPEVGDVRVQFSYAGKSGDAVSIVALQSGAGGVLAPYRSAAGHEVLLVHPGHLTVEELFLHEHGQNRRMTWALRAAGWLALYLGASCLTTIIRLLVIRYTLLYDILVMGLGSINLAVSISTSLLVLAFAWMWYRPLLGLCLVFAAAVPFVGSAMQVYRERGNPAGDGSNSYRRL